MSGTTPKKSATKKSGGPTKPPRTAAEIIRDAKLPERSVNLCLRGDLVAQVEDLERHLDAARKQDAGRLTGNAQARRIAEQIEQLREEMDSSTITFLLRGLPRRDWPKLVAEHPPRDGNRDDQSAGINLDSFFDVLVRRCVVDPELDEDEWSQLLGALTTSQWDQLVSAAWGLNKDEVRVPFSPLASASLRSSGEQ